MVTNKDLENLAEKIALDLTNIHLGNALDAHWPFSINFMAKFCVEEISKYMYNLFCKNKEQSKILDLILKNTKYPSQIAQYFYFLAGSRVFLSNEERYRLASIFLEIISKLREDPLCLDGSNKLKDFDINSTHLSKFTTQDPKRLNFALQSYLELIIPTIMPLSREFHGPYNLPNGKKLIVKDYYNLKPDFFNLKERIKSRRVVIYEIYNNTPPKFDFFNHITYNYTYPTESFVFIDSKFAKKEDVERVINEIKNIMNIAILEDKKSFVKNFVNAILDSFGELNNPPEVKKIKRRVFKKIEESELKEEKSNPYEGLKKEEIYERLLSSFMKTFGLII